MRFPWQRVFSICSGGSAGGDAVVEVGEFQNKKDKKKLLKSKEFGTFFIELLMCIRVIRCMFTQGTLIK